MRFVPLQNQLFLLRFLSVFSAFLLVVLSAAPVQARVTEFNQAVAEAASRDPDLAAFYRARNFEGIWSNRGDRARRNALITAFSSAGDHGLPTARYDAEALMAQLQSAQTPAEQGRLEVELSRLFLEYARDVQTGMLIPSQVIGSIHRQVPYRPRLQTLQAFAQSNPAAFLRALPPNSPEYTRLMRQKMAMERLVATGGWGAVVPGNKLERGDTGSGVVALRNRLIAMGFLGRTNTQTYDDTIVAAVQRFQQAHGLATDGTAGPGTLREINRSVVERLQSVIVAMERERWINRPKGERHIWVNLTDFSAQIIDNDVVTFSTRSVIGAREDDRESPEFSDVMEFMVINPSWYVPRSIITKEYLPQLQRNPNAVSQLIITDTRGRVVDRNAVDFTRYSRTNFPYSMRQPPSRGNALGLVKFMFPNRYNIYLHDTPAKSLFSRETRAYSHGCIRLADPFDFAYALLAPQTSDPEGLFQAELRTGRERRVDLADPVPVHLVYRTAFTQAEGPMQYRRDVYGRDARIWNALAREGVVIRAVGG
ncbi:L,D-transpeptidase family protein [Cognatiyoonia sp. IB215182]|uniref:L,D-transpeptidase family protein n=1 Tax=Cognatiyoonia sp. IB215182 TaxID=3097353 RepID=UPI002A11378F|nr:L,D-transpeptidase family protein [Cognatiyoonia sp. IB215182]MDX8352060.1 L,D-transpeptidase family protein [Cognatiyoonia sp. IB215182]